jgi:CubicO group peptidase (beta-lactamase class C family)
MPAPKSLCLLALALPALAQLPESLRKSIDSAVAQALAATAVPSASVAVVQDGKLAYAQAYGFARLDSKLRAQTGMRYKIGSNSKQFTAAAILLLSSEGKISLDDPVAKYFPDLTRARDITIRQLLAHQSGYQDYYAIDFTPPWMTRPTNGPNILDTWARKPLDFEPGSQYQYSNTNYVIAGMIFEKITGRPLMDFLRARIFQPLDVQSPVDLDREPWSRSDPEGYTRYALGPMRPVPPEGPGWLIAAGELAMTASDLARWNISLMNGTILPPALLRALTTEVPFTSGTGARYGLGLSVSAANGRRVWSHSGAVSGFVSNNVVLPDDRAAFTVLTNGEGGAASQIARKVQPLLTQADDPDAARDLERARGIFSGLQQGNLDRSLLTEDASAYFTPEVIRDFSTSLKPLGRVAAFTQSTISHRGGMTYRIFAAKAGSRTLNVEVYLMPGGQIDQFLVRPRAE